MPWQWWTRAYGLAAWRSISQDYVFYRQQSLETDQPAQTLSGNGANPASTFTESEDFFRAGQWQLVWWKFRRHRLAQSAMWVLALFYFIVLFAEFIAPHAPLTRYKDLASAPPTRIRLYEVVSKSYRSPFVYAIVRSRDPVTARPIYKANAADVSPIGYSRAVTPIRCWG